MARSISCSGLLALGLLVAIPTSAMAEGFPRLLALDCTLAVSPDPENICQASDPSSLRGSRTLIAESADSSALVDIDRVAATFGLNGPTILRVGAEPIVASSGRDVGTTGSIGAPASK